MDWYYGTEKKDALKTAQDWKEKGIWLYEKGRYSEAVEVFQKSIKLDPNDIAIWNKLANSLAALGRYEEALATFEHAIEIDPNDLKVWLNLGTLLSNLDRHEEAIKVLDRALDIEPWYFETWYEKGKSLERLGRIEEAVNAYERATSLVSVENKRDIKEKLIALETFLDKQPQQQTVSPIKIEKVSKSRIAEVLHNNSPYLVIERTIFDPVSGMFVISKNRPLINIESWIRKTDPNYYWFVVCIHNNSASSVDDWGIELNASASLKILECHIEGIEHFPTLDESHPVPWQSKWSIGVSHHFGITLPRKGSRRLYFKLSSSICGVSHSISGNLIAPDDIRIPILEKTFEHSCDVATLSTAITKNPAAAEKYTENFLKYSYSRETALKYLNSFKIIQAVDRSCAVGNYDATIDKLHDLIDALEGIQESQSLIESVRCNLWAIEKLGDSSDASARGQRLCENLVNDWMDEVIFKRSTMS